VKKVHTAGCGGGGGGGTDVLELDPCPLHAPSFIVLPSSFVGSGVSLISRSKLALSFHVSRSNKCSTTPAEPYVD